MSQIETCLVRLQQRGFVGGQKVHGLVQIKKRPRGLPQSQQERQQQDAAGGKVRAGFESIFKAMLPVRGLWTLGHGWSRP